MQLKIKYKKEEEINIHKPNENYTEKLYFLLVKFTGFLHCNKFLRFQKSNLQDLFNQASFCCCSLFYRLEMFKCNNGDCVPKSNKCDYIDDCGDSSDEFECSEGESCCLLVKEATESSDLKPFESVF